MTRWVVRSASAVPIKLTHYRPFPVVRDAGIASQSINFVCSGPLPRDTALRLAHFFGSSAQFWLNLQALYELRLAERKAGKAIKALPTLKRGRSESALHVEHHMREQHLVTAV